MKCLEKNEAVQRMMSRNTSSIKWTLRDMTVEWSLIPAREARNYDGSIGGCDHDPGRTILQCVIWRDNEAPRWTNYW